MKILFIQTNYPAFLKRFYNKHPNWESYSYEKLKEKWKNELFGSSGFYSKALKNLGWKTMEVTMDDWNSQSKWAEENNIQIGGLKDVLLRKVPFPIKTRLGVIDNWITKVLLKQIELFSPNVVYFHHLGLLDKNELQEVKRRTKLLVGQIASPLPDKKLLKEFDLIISSFPHFVKKFKEIGVDSEFLKWCAEKSIPKKIGKKKRIYDVSYVGAFTPHHSEGNKMLETLASEVKVDFWGYGQNTLLPTSPIRKNFHGQAWGREMYEIFAKSKIVVNRHINVAENYANNLRMYEATLMGVLLITDHKKNLDKIFKVGKEAVAYKNSSGLIKKVKYYLDHDKEREKIAKAGQKRTLKDHTYDVRMKELDKILRRYLNK